VSTPSYVCFSAQDWWYFNHAHSDFQLMLRIAETRKVLFVNSITLRMPLPGRSSHFVRRLVRKARSMTKRLSHPEPDLPHFAVFTPLVLPLYGSERARRLNARLIAGQVRRVAKRLEIRAPVYVVTIPTAVDVLSHLHHGPLIYNRSDRHSAFGEADRDTIGAMEDRLLQEADRVLYVSSALMAEEASIVGDRGVFLDHGVDAEHFALREQPTHPADIADLSGPIIGFFGGLDDYLVDLELIAKLARAIPEATVLLIGEASHAMDLVETIPNVRWLGARPYADIPSYGACFDVAIMPWLDNDWIRYANPIKLKEYLALGLPVVSTDFPEVHRYREFVRIAPTGDAFISAVRQTLADHGLGTPEQRRQAVADVTWHSRAASLLEISEAVATER
jgi:glycosyltransferase involved in cell wall biosynthesis